MKPIVCIVVLALTSGCTKLAGAYLSGLAGALDDGRAVALLSGSCFDGHMPACGELGVLYASGRGVPKDLPHARAQFARACGAGHAPSCAELKTPAGRWTQAGK